MCRCRRFFHFELAVPVFARIFVFPRPLSHHVVVAAGLLTGGEEPPAAGGRLEELVSGHAEIVDMEDIWSTSVPRSSWNGPGRLDAPYIHAIRNPHDVSES